MKWGLAGPRGWFAQGVVPNAEIGTLALRDWQNLPRPRARSASTRRARPRACASRRSSTRWRVPMEWIVPGERGGGVVNRYDDPAALGAARWSSLRRRATARARERAASAAVRRRQRRAPLVTIDALDATACSTAASSLPGLHLMLRTLAEARAGAEAYRVRALARVPDDQRRRARRPARCTRRAARSSEMRARAAPRRRAGPLLPRGRRRARDRAAPRRAGGGRG